MTECNGREYHRHPAKKIAHIHDHVPGHHLMPRKFDKPETPTDDDHLMWLLKRSIKQAKEAKQ